MLLFYLIICIKFNYFTNNVLMFTNILFKVSAFSMSCKTVIDPMMEGLLYDKIGKKDKAVRNIGINKRNYLVIIGPTAVGKTKLSIEMAKRYNGEIISGDSMQIYKGMDIGTAKIKEDEKEGIPHYLIDIKEPVEPFSAAEFQDLAQCKIEEIQSKGKLPIIVGGTGLYIQSVIYDYQFSEAPSDQHYRAKLEKIVTEEGIENVFARIEGDRSGKC